MRRWHGWKRAPSNSRLNGCRRSPGDRTPDENASVGRPTAGMRPGGSCHPTTRNGRGSTASATSWRRSPTSASSSKSRSSAGGRSVRTTSWQTPRRATWCPTSGEAARPGRPGRWRRSRLDRRRPVQKEAHVAGNPAGEVDDHRLQLVALGLDARLEGVVHLLGLALQCVRPVRIGIVDRSAAVGAEIRREAVDHRLHLPFLHSELHETANHRPLVIADPGP